MIDDVEIFNWLF